MGISDEWLGVEGQCCGVLAGLVPDGKLQQKNAPPSAPASCFRGRGVKHAGFQ